MTAPAEPLTIAVPRAATITTDIATMPPHIQNVAYVFVKPNVKHWPWGGGTAALSLALLSGDAPSGFAARRLRPHLAVQPTAPNSISAPGRSAIAFVGRASPAGSSAGRTPVSRRRASRSQRHPQSWRICCRRTQINGDRSFRRNLAIALPASGTSGSRLLREVSIGRCVLRPSIYAAAVAVECATGPQDAPGARVLLVGYSRRDRSTFSRELSAAPAY